MILCVVSLMGFAPAQASTPPCPEDPHPCGDEWPDDVGAGPFELKEVTYERLEVPADWDDPEGPKIELEGWIGIPDVPAGVRVPVALNSTPYLGDCYLGATECDPTPDDAAWWADPVRRTRSRAGARLP